ncbi:hypothetical protein CBL_12320 [Carabus blaptoides fortunei]
MRKGEIYGMQSGCLKIVKWVDKRPVLMLTTDPEHTTNLISTGKKSRSGEDIVKPKAVIDYNKAKKGVDYSDQMSSYHTVLRRGLKWYRKLLFELLFGTSLVNAWLIYNKISSTKLSITAFRKTLAAELITPPTAETDNITPKRKAHTFIKRNGSGRKKRRMCQGFYKELRLTLSSREANNKVTKVTSYCDDCAGKPGLCLQQEKILFIWCGSGLQRQFLPQSFLLAIPKNSLCIEILSYNTSTAQKMTLYAPNITGPRGP